MTTLLRQTGLLTFTNPLTFQRCFRQGQVGLFRDSDAAVLAAIQVSNSSGTLVNVFTTVSSVTPDYDLTSANYSLYGLEPVQVLGTSNLGNWIMAALLPGYVVTGWTWKRRLVDGSETVISGATSQSYQLQSADVVPGTIVYPLPVGLSNTGKGVYAPVASAPAPAPAPAPADTRARFFVAPANAHTVGTQGFIDGATVMGGSANGSKAGTFSLTTTPGNYGWAVLDAAASASGANFVDVGAGNAPGGWAGAGLAGANTGTSPAVNTSSVVVTDSTSGTQKRLFRQDYPNANPTPEAWAVS